jgi:hypothetical protein
MAENRNEYMRRYRNTPEYKAKKKAADAKRFRTVKKDPVKLEAHRARNRNWWRKNLSNYEY